MKAQKYKVLGMGTDRNDAVAPGQFVFRTGVDNVVKGFVSAVYGSTFDVVLWEPDELPNLTNYIVIYEEMKMQDIVNELSSIFENNTSLIAKWAPILEIFEKKKAQY